MARYINVPLKLAILGTARRQKDIAHDALITPGALSHAIHGRKDLSTLEQKRVAKVLGRTVAELFPPAPLLPLPELDRVKEMMR